MNKFSKNILVGIAFFTCLAAVCKGRTGNVWRREEVLDSKGDYKVFWDWNEENITFEVQVRTKGYVGFGFSPNGGMSGADIVIGWVKDNKVYFKDRFASGNSVPLVDESQDYELLVGFENDTHTVLRFQRKLDTCDDQDFKITKDTMRMIYAWHDEDPEDTTPDYHGSQTRGTKSLKVLDKKFNKLEFGNEVYTWDMKMPNITVPDIHTSYKCKYFKFPQQTAKLHRVGMDVVIQPGNENVVHHIVLYQCNEKMSSAIEAKLNDPTFNCVDDEIFISLCPAMILSRPLGRDGEALPENVGVPFGHDDKPTYFMLQTHFTNPDLRTDINDQTTMRIHLTSKLRKYEGGVIYIRVEKTYPLIIPPKQTSFKYIVVTPPQCTQLLPEGGINIYSVNFHMHLTGRKGHARQFRNGVELPLITEDNYYDFNYQQPTELASEVKILPGDTVAMECEYNTMERENLTLGGSKTTNEMCTLMLYYYPRSQLAMVKTRGSENELLNIFGIQNVLPGYSHINEPSNLRNVSLTDYLENFDIKKLTTKDISEIQLVQIDNPILSGMCLKTDNTKMHYNTVRESITKVPYKVQQGNCSYNKLP